jgi:hypothetical protein
MNMKKNVGDLKMSLKQAQKPFFWKVSAKTVGSTVGGGNLNAFFPPVAPDNDTIQEDCPQIVLER